MSTSSTDPVGHYKRGKSESREGAPATAVPGPFVEAIPWWATGMRPGQIRAMRGCYLTFTGKLWLYQPAHHKAEYHGHERTVYLGRRAQEIIRPFLKADLAAHPFSPAEAEAGRRKARTLARATPLSCGKRPDIHRVGKPRRTVTWAYRQR